MGSKVGAARSPLAGIGTGFGTGFAICGRCDWFVVIGSESKGSWCGEFGMERESGDAV